MGRGDLELWVAPNSPAFSPPPGAWSKLPCPDVLFLSGSAGMRGNRHSLLSLCPPNRYPHLGIKTPNALGVPGECTPSAGHPGAMASWRVVLCPQGWLLLNSSRCTWGRGRGGPQGLTFRFRKGSPDVCENPWFLNADIKSKLK